MIIGIPRERKDGEARVALTPAGARLLIQHRHRVLVEGGAGAGAGFSDDEYMAGGASLCERPEAIYREAELVVKVKEPLPQEWALLQSHQTVFTYLHLAADPALTRALIQQKVTAIAYETAEGPPGMFPLLKPMSEIAGRLAIQAGAHYLEAPLGGAGVLLGGATWVPSASVVILGGGVVGRTAARVATGMGADVTVMDVDPAKLTELDDYFQGRIDLLLVSPQELEETIPRADLLIGAIMVAGARAPLVVGRELIKRMRPGRVVVDVAIDQGGCVETSRPTTHSDPVYREGEILHYCVTNMPAAVPRTATLALTAVTLPWIVELADKGVREAVRENPALARGVNVYQGQVTHEGVGRSLDLPVVSLAQAMGTGC